MTRLDDALVRASDVLNELGKGFALVGGIAVSALTAPRSTGDVDVAVAVADDGEAEAVAGSFMTAGYGVASVLEQDETGRLAGVRVHDAATGVGLDLMFAMCGVEPEIVASAQQIEVLPGTVLPVASIGSLIVMKLLARDDRRRPTDADDLRSLAEVATDSDWAEAHRLAELVTVRNAHRKRDLAASLSQLQAHGAF
ncbi:nucleotidyl transferase AbiEii/AbiGii toxin family protein [Candidatus Poriferisodalis sp.]|uniref:nucleotidyl transferase AbiEii/AbiGii toxin family protein n=1 Tax=Candidatus Poriferisodalis sp. TaxID=3101277 RepID=UPI003B5CBCA7